MRERCVPAAAPAEASFWLILPSDSCSHYLAYGCIALFSACLVILSPPQCCLCSMCPLQGNLSLNLGSVWNIQNNLISSSLIIRAKTFFTNKVTFTGSGD